ncbi:peptide chain release factor N(5)-glutamine methyltransferase [Acidobacteriota bacterium]
MSSIPNIYNEGRECLKNLETPDLDARILLCYSMGLSDIEFLTSPDKVLLSSQVKRYRRLIERRLQGVPVAYLTGIKEFWSLTFHVSRGVLIPRPETEQIIECVLEEKAGNEEVIVDLCTGSGNIAISLAKEIPDCTVFAVDVSRKVLWTARQNASRLETPNVHFLKGSLFQPLRKLSLERKCDFIVSNPPYVGAEQWHSLPDGIRLFEPKSALVSGDSGFEIIDQIVRESPVFLKPHGKLVFEIGIGQRDRALSLFGEEWGDAACLKDLSGIPRIITATLK